MQIFEDQNDGMSGALGAKHASKEELADLRKLIDEYEMGKKGKK